MEWGVGDLSLPTAMLFVIYIQNGIARQTKQVVVKYPT